MKKLLILPIFISASLLTLAPAHANEGMSLRICEYVQANDKSRLRSFLKL